jgi:transcriptional regulator with XRE-family HTH domain
MVLGKILDLFDPGRPPNTFTELMGELVKQARIDSGFNQRELAEKLYTRQATISDIENGKRWVNTGELVALSAILDKPILYFVPEKYRRIFRQNITDPEIQELVLVAKKLSQDDLSRLIIQARALIKRGK